MSEAQPIHFAFEGPEGKVRITPPVFINNTLRVNPSDLTQFAPEGTGVYGLREHTNRNPFKEGPVHEPSGGTLFFDNDVRKEDFLGLSRILDITTNKDYAAFLSTSDAPGKDGYLSQLRLVSKFGLKYLYDAISETEYESFPEQELTMPEALYAFIDNQRNEYGTFFGEPKLERKFGGDGDYAREQLSFGFMVENEYFSVYRIWSRAWLVTK
jgi:hypothetical protein